MYYLPAYINVTLQALNLSYASVINTEPYATLTQLLSSNAADRVVLSSKFITTCNLDSTKVIDLHCFLRFTLAIHELPILVLAQKKYDPTELPTENTTQNTYGDVTFPECKPESQIHTH